MHEDEIIIRFEPYAIACMPNRVDHEVISSLGVTVKLMQVEWCVLPDILFDEKNRKFLGLSFLVSQSHAYFVKKMVSRIRDKRCQYVSRNEDADDRYAGFGQSDRLEISWDVYSDRAVCELASLDTGAWLYSVAESGQAATSVPIGFNLMCVDDIVTAYNLL